MYRTPVSKSEGLSSFPSSSSTKAGSVAVTPSRLKCLSDLKGELTCGICLDVCARPTTTPCGHNFCLRCLQALYRITANRIRSGEVDVNDDDDESKRQKCVECPKCRQVVCNLGTPENLKCLSEGRTAYYDSLEVNSALWNVIQLLFPRLELKSPNWKIESPQPNPRSPLSGRFVNSARLMLQLGETNQEGSGATTTTSAASELVEDHGDLAGEGPVLDMRNRRPVSLPPSVAAQERGRAATSSVMRMGEGATGGRGGELDTVPRIGFMTAREMLMRSQQHYCERAPHEVMEYA